MLEYYSLFGRYFFVQWDPQPKQYGGYDYDLHNEGSQFKPLFGSFLWELLKAFSSYGEHEENQLSEMKHGLIYSLGTWCSLLLIA